MAWIKSSFFKSTFFNNFLPLVTVLFGGIYMMQYVMSKRREEEMQNRTIDWEELKKQGINITGQYNSLEDVYVEMQREIAEQREWKNVRAPRYWEDNAEYLAAREAADRRVQEELQRKKKHNDENHN